VSASSAWQLLWWVGAIFCVLAGAWFLALTVPEEGSPLAWFGARLWPGLYSGGCVPQEATIGGFCEPWARLLLIGAAGDKPMAIHKRGPHGGLRSSGCSEGGPGLGGVVRSLFSDFGFLLLEGVVKSATPAMMFNQGGCSTREDVLLAAASSDSTKIVKGA
jgi:hypothetical protein